MSDFPRPVDYPPSVINSFSPNSLGMTEIAVAAINTTGAWVANLAVYIPFFVGYPKTIAKMFWVNGSTVGTNNVDVGIYNGELNRLVSSGSTLTAGASVVQSVDITDTLLQPGLYYMAMAVDGTTDTFSRQNTAAVITSSSGVYQQASAFPLPSTATPVELSNALIPMLSLTSRATI